MKTDTIEYLAYLIKQAKEKNKAKPIVFLGAGASKTGGVPLAKEIIENILNDFKDNPNINDLKEEEKTYANLMSLLLPDQRNQLLKGYINDAKINVTHIYLAQLIVEGYIDYVLTVNFDNLMLRALALYNVFPPTYDMAILKDMTTTSFKQKSVVFLHGQHHGLWLLNTSEEMKKVDLAIPRILDTIKNERAWIFIGYSGEDPIFKHFTELGRFDNGLYWIAYNDNDPCELVCKNLLEKDNINASIIKGYDSDSFMIKLNSVLELPQPLIIDKPFTSLKNTLEKIVDIDDKEHFKGAKERFEIAKRDVAKAINQFEEGLVEPNKILKEEIDLNILKKQIISEIINQNFDETTITNLEKSIEGLNNDEISSLMAELYNSWGNLLYRNAKLKKDELLYKNSFEKYKKAMEFNDKDSTVFLNWGTSLSGLAKIMDNDELYKESFEKFAKSAELAPDIDSIYNNWGGAIYNFAKARKNEQLFLESIEKYKKALALNPNKDIPLNNWGNSLADLAKITKDKKLFLASFEKYKEAIDINPKSDSAYYNWANSIAGLARLNNEEPLFRESFSKYLIATLLNPKKDSAFINWGLALHNLANIKNDEKLYVESFEKFAKAAEINPNDVNAYTNWGAALTALAKLKNDQNLFKQALEKINIAIEFGGESYNLACLYAIQNDKINSLAILEKSLIKKEIDIDFVKQDDDWANFLNDNEFIELLNKYK